MITVHHDVLIERTVADVFAFVADSRNDPKWCPPVLEVKQLNGTDPELGAKYEMVANPGPTKTQGAFQITRFEPNEHAEYEGENGMLRFRYNYMFTTQDNTTKVSMTSELRPKGLWKVLQPVIRAGTKKVTVEEFENLKRLLERESESAV